jgi:hypothetical protein
VITGDQIRAARELLGWTRFMLSQRANLHVAIIERAEESAPGAPPITAYQHAVLRSTLEAAGVEFTNGHKPRAKLKAKGRSAK